MRRTFLALAGLLGVAGQAIAETPKATIRGPVRLPVDGTIVLDARSSISDRPLKWKLEGPDVPFLTLDQDGRRGVVALVPAAPEGVYRFTLIAVGIPDGESEIDADAAIHVVTVESAAPPVPPAPPGPAPGPLPVSGTIHVSLVLDLDSLTPEVARLRESPKARAAFEGLNVVYRTYAHTSPDATRLNLVALAGKVGLPAVLIQDQTGKILWSGRAPPSESEMIALVKSFRGGA